MEQQMTNSNLPSLGVTTNKKRKSGFQEFWRRFKKNKLAVAGLAIVVLYVLMAIFADLFYSYDFITQNQISNAFAKPLTRAEVDDGNMIMQHLYILGADNFGRDILGRIIHGARISMIIGFTTIAFAGLIGSVLGAIAGYYGGVIESIIMRGTDILLAIPNILFALAIVAALGPSFQNLLLAIGITSIPAFVRLMRASVLTIKDQEFIEAARALGAHDFRIIVRHIMPNCMAPIIVQATLG